LSIFGFSVRQFHEGETMSQFLVLIYDDPARWDSVSPAELQQAVEKYRAWTQKPFTRDAKRLGGDPGRVIRSNGGKPRVTDGPYSETKEVLGGFYLIEAENYEAAVALAVDHPHLEYGGTLEIRELWHA
jgi:hypothetical protein